MVDNPPQVVNHCLWSLSLHTVKGSSSARDSSTTAAPETVSCYRSKLFRFEGLTVRMPEQMVRVRLPEQKLARKQWCSRHACLREKVSVQAFFQARAHAFRFVSPSYLVFIVWGRTAVFCVLRSVSQTCLSRALGKIGRDATGKTGTKTARSPGALSIPETVVEALFQACLKGKGLPGTLSSLDDVRVVDMDGELKDMGGSPRRFSSGPSVSPCGTYPYASCLR